jgi:UTP--glucose-1-phosphate uridylyltransferase
VGSYGIIKDKPLRERLYRVLDMVEKPSPADAPSNLAIIGRYILPPEIFGILEITPAGIGGEIQLTDALKRLLPTTSILGLEYEGKRFDAGNKAGLIKANVYLGLQHPEVRDELAAFIRSLDIGQNLQ